MSSIDLRDLGGGTIHGLLAARAAAAPDNVAVVSNDVEITYGELNERAERLASSLIGAGLKRGDAVNLFMTNRIEFLVAFFGILRAGLTFVPVNTGYKQDFLLYAIEHADARAIITETRLAEPLSALAALPQDVNHVVFVDGRPDSFPHESITAWDWDDFIATGKSGTVFPEVQPGDVSGIFYTSGTTGRSKGVISPHLKFTVMAREAAVAMGTTSTDRLYTCLPLFHGGALFAVALHAIYAGGAVCVSERFSASRFWDEIRAYRATFFFALGSVLPVLLNQPPSDRDRDHQVTRIFAAPAPADVLYRFEARFGVHIIEGYGLSEVKNILYNPREGRKVGSLGKPTASSIIEVHDERGHRVSPGQVGEIVYRPRFADIMFKGYHRDPDATLATMSDLWWHTGDAGTVDDDGFFYFLDRKKDALRRRGENISSQEVEAVVASYPGVLEAAAVAAKSDLGEDEVMVVVEVVDPDAFDEEKLFMHCDRRMPHFMVPRYIRVVGSLPKTPTGKIRKVELRDRGLGADVWDATTHGLTPTRNL
ncbi:MULTISPECIES: AMP-binding protein [unclassified Aeromicrobium]|uniref:AMP-binding protein n=1 Tax=unclassified Aeromicrobium TaxID=2633570 RepID=UPI00396AF40A